MSPAIRISRRRALLAAGAACLLPVLPSVAFSEEAPALQEAIAAGKLPPLPNRLPATPRIVDMASLGKAEGRYGGAMRMIMASVDDIRMMTAYSYARLVVFDERLNLVADILDSFQVEEGRAFTLRLRRGHRWSDGHPFTTEDFRYFWDDVANNDKLSRGGPDQVMMVDGKPPKFEVVDEVTVRYSWEKPNPSFLPSLAGASPNYIFMPAHYLKQFNKRYADPATLKKLVAANHARNWAALHTVKARQYKAENPDLPTLESWSNTIAPPAERFIFKRNPYFHRVDKSGRQLPYIDTVFVDISSADIIPAKTGAGESDLQGRYLLFNNYTFLKQAEKQHPIGIDLWRQGTGSQVAFLPNLNVNDLVWRKVLRDVRFRRALSLAIFRHELNQQFYFGLAHEAANTVLDSSPLYKASYDRAWAQYDPDKANALLDEMGLKRGPDDWRRLPDGRIAEMIVELRSNGQEEEDMMELVEDYWRAIGLKTYPRTLQLDVLRRRFLAGDTLISMWSGLSVGDATADMSPEELAPVSSSQGNWPKWGEHTESGGAAGEAVDLPEAKKLLDLYNAWRVSSTTAERRGIWDQMLGIFTDQVFTIGTVNGVFQPVVFNTKLRNLPKKGIYSFAPGAYFGMYMIDTLWYDEGERGVIRYIAFRLLAAIPTLVLISALVFFIIQLPPGNYFDTYVAELQAQGETVDPNKIAYLKHEYGFDKPVVEQYGIWVWNMLHGDFGYSFEYEMPVTQVVGSRLYLTILVSMVTIIFTWLIAFPIGIYSATHQYSWSDYGLTFLGLLGLATPNFLLALVLMYLANVWFGTSIGHLMDAKYLGQPLSWDKFKSVAEHMIIPVVVIGTSGTAGMIRRLRANLLDELQKQYVVTARAKGVPPLRALLKYPLRMSLNFFIADIGGILPSVISGAEVVAIVLSLETTGPLLIRALQAQDMYLAGSFLMFLATLTIIGVLISDIALALLDPRIRLQVRQTR